MSEAEFRPWGKTERFKGFGVTITCKIDGTNALVYVGEDGTVRAGSRNRWISPGKTTDNYGFAAWVEAHAEELRVLGPGYHYGEWWGSGIGRGYGVELRKLSLFDTRRFAVGRENTPKCVDVVPILYEGGWSGREHLDCLEQLASNGSVAAPGFRRPEGIIMYFHLTGQRFKYLLENHDKHKWEVSP